MERRDIEIFLTLAEELHFTRTAQRLGISSARVSQSIKRLERRFGVPLFHRTSRQVALTPVGATLRDDLQAGYQRIQQGIARAVAAGRRLSGILRVGFSSPLAGELIMKAAAAFRARHAGYDVQIREIHLSDAFGALRSGDIDMQVSELPVRESDLSCGPALLRDPRMLAVAASHPFAARAAVTVDDLTRDPVLIPVGAPGYLLDTLVPAHTPNGSPVVRVAALTSRQELLTLVSAGRGVAVVGSQATRYHARPDIAYVPIDGLPPIAYGPVWRTGEQTHLMRSFLTVLRDAAPRRSSPTGARRAGPDDH